MTKAFNPNISNILMNIESEAVAHLKYGKELPKRDPRWDKEVEQALIKAKEQMDTDFEQVYQTQYNAHNPNMPYDEWITIAKALYFIHGTTVTSIAKGLDNVKTWQYKSYADAQKQVKKLLSYKFHDHFNKGATFMFIPPHLKVVGE